MFFQVKVYRGKKRTRTFTEVSECEVRMMEKWLSEHGWVARGNGIYQFTKGYIRQTIVISET